MVKVIPDGYEVYENPNAQVFLRKIIPRIITDKEIDSIRNGVRNFSKIENFKIDIKNNQIIIFLPDQNVGSLKNSFSDFPLYNEEKFNRVLEQVITYLPMMRFVLIDEAKREFSVERSCFKGFADDWILLDTDNNLERLVKKYCFYLNKESFYDLI